MTPFLPPSLSLARPSRAQRLLTGSALSLAVTCASLSPAQADGGQAPTLATLVQIARAKNAEPAASLQQAQAAEPLEEAEGDESDAPAEAEGDTVTAPTISIESDRPWQPERVQSPKFQQPLRDTPRTIIVIPEEVIEERGQQSITDVLRTTPGISLGAGEGGVPLGDRAFIRGFDARTDMFVDGARDFGGYSRDPFNLEQVEIVKGPSSAYSGRGSTGGSINQVSKKPGLETFYDASTTFGTDWTKRGTVDINQSLQDYGIEGVAFRLNLLGHDADVAGRDEVTQTRWGIAPSLAFGLGTDTRAILSYYHLGSWQIPDYGHPFDDRTGEPIDVDRDNFYGLTDRDQDNVTVNIGTVELEHDFNEHVAIQNQTRYSHVTKDFIVTKPEYNQVGSDLVDRSDRSRDSADSLLINQTDLLLDFDTGPVGHNLTFSMEFAREFSGNRGKTIPDGPDADLYDPDPDTPYTGVITEAAMRAESYTHSAAASFFESMEIGRYVELNGGVRWDGIKTDYTNQNGDEFYREDSVFSYSAGIVLKPVEPASFYFSYGTSTNPSQEGLTLSDTTEALPPEKTRTYEVGVKWDVLDEALSLTAAAFRTIKANARTSTGRGQPQVLDGEEQVQGIELGVAGNITEDWTLFGGYTLLDSEIKSSAQASEVGNEFANIPDHSLSLWSGYQVTPEFRIGGGVTFASERWANNQNTEKLPGYWRVDAMAGYQVTENIDLQLNIINMLDERYYDSTHVGQHALVAPGRSALLTASFRY